jgi:hypothetical protein
MSKSKYEIPPEYDKPWVRMPNPGENIYGLSRSTLFEMARTGKIRSAHHKKPGRIKGIRLLWLPSLVEYLDKLADQTQQTATKE